MNFFRNSTRGINPLKSKSIISSTILVAVATICVRFSGFLREITLAGSYGAGVESDAFIIAFSIPTIVLALFGTSAATVFIPAYSRLEGDKDYFTRNVITVLALIGLLFTAIIATFPQVFIYLFASQLGTDSFLLATELLRIMMWAAIPILLIGLLQSFLQIKNAFFLALALTLPINIYIILSILLSKSIENTFAMGFGVVAGNVMALIFLFTAAYYKGFVYKPVLDLKMPEIKGLIILLTPVMLATLISDINLIVDRNFASSLVVGSISSLNYASKTINILVMVIGASIAAVLYPRMSEFAAQDNTSEIRRCVSESIKRLIPVLLPATVGIFILAKPIVRIFFERGEFTSQNTQMATECMQMYAPLLFFASINIIVTRALFSVGDTKSPAIITAIGVGVSIVINFILIGPLAHMGLALSSSISAMLSTVLLLFALRKRVGLLHLKREGKEWVKVLVATVVMGLAVSVGYFILPVMDGSTMQSILMTGVLIIGGVGVYLLAHIILQTMFIRESVAMIRGFLASRGDAGKKV